ncbi:hypothetical protein EMPS_09451 [Entomortierella parvispora]|uniref:Transmembrane protein n=1 Tax=Entomortierella parvispora TaxID=205924 RepID=A0A9P3M0E3_9FUNG|nr:hypothetical protein EMPS_09451 [Entomortierella parvispora]
MTSHQLLSVVPGSTVVPIAQRLQDNKYQLHSTFNPNRHSLPSAHALYHNQHTLFQSQKERPQQFPNPLLQKQLQQQHQFQEKPRAGGPRLSLDTSDERLQNVTVINHGNRRYLKLFSPGLVESPQSFLNQKQLVEDKNLWENGPNAAFQKQLEVEKREAYRARSKQQLRGFFMGLWLGCLLGVLIVQQTSTKIYYWRHDFLSSFTPLIVLLVAVSCVIVLRSGTRCTIAAVATCAAVLTCFATLIVNQSRYSPEFRVYGSRTRHVTTTTTE